MEDHSALELLRAKLETVHDKMRQLNENWEETTKGLHLGPDGQVLDADGRPYR